MHTTVRLIQTDLYDFIFRLFFQYYSSQIGWQTNDAAIFAQRLVVFPTGINNSARHHTD